MVDNERFADIIKIYSDVRRMQIKEQKANDPNRIIRRPAGDDWF